MLDDLGQQLDAQFLVGKLEKLSFYPTDVEQYTTTDGAAYMVLNDTGLQENNLCEAGILNDPVFIV